MKIKELLNREVDLKTFLLTGPLGAIYSMFSRKIIKESKNTNIVYDIRHGKPVVIQSEKYMNQYDKTYGAGEAMRPGFALDSVKYGMKREICDQIMKSDLFEWSIDETITGTRVAARIIVNKF
jgi:hypothetical protein